jgi:hypothetical protein
MQRLKAQMFFIVSPLSDIRKSKCTDRLLQLTDKSNEQVSEAI